MKKLGALSIVLSWFVYLIALNLLADKPTMFKCDLRWELIFAAIGTLLALLSVVLNKGVHAGIALTKNFLRSRNFLRYRIEKNITIHERYYWINNNMTVEI
ncbi:hypothetical protein [uncultured Paraglaciecola sp.]|uniref:hypothetical protein n=1 Tax=uncultured Paraglaciecola sp. TaxID=1765024 RepID=UPI0030D8981C